MLSGVLNISVTQLSFEQAKAKRDQYHQMVADLKPKLKELGVDLDSPKISSRKSRKKGWKSQVIGIEKETKPNPHRIFMSVCLREGKGMKTCNEEWKIEKREAIPVG